MASLTTLPTGLWFKQHAEKHSSSLHINAFFGSNKPLQRILPLLLFLLLLLRVCALDTHLAPVSITQHIEPRNNSR